MLLIPASRRPIDAPDLSGSSLGWRGLSRRPYVQRGAVVLAGVAVALGLVLVLESPSPLVGHLVLVVSLIPLVIIDLEDHRLPREISYPAAVISAAVLLVGDASSWIGVVGGAAAMTALLAGFALVSRGGLGAGDVRVGPLLGANIGYHAVVGVVVAVWLAAAFAVLFAIPALIARRRKRSDAIAFGPFLAVASIAVIALYAI